MENGMPKVLVVEDEKPLARALELKLSHANCQVDVAKTGKEAMGFLQDNSYDMVITDLIMPEMDGFEVIRKARSQTPELKITVLSNLGQESDMKKVRELGVEDYFIKANTPISSIIRHVQEKLGND